MFRNHLLIAWRNFSKHKAFSITNTLGLAVGMAACLLVLQYVVFEMRYDAFHAKSGHIYRVAGKRYVAGQLDGQTAQSYHAAGPAMKKDFPEVEQYTRVRPWYGNTMVSHTVGMDVSILQPVTIRTKRFSDSASVSLAGSFNGWNPNLQPMAKQGDEWVAKLQLAPGRHMYKFVVNGQWLTDPDNPEVDTADHYNSVFMIPETDAYQKAARNFREVAFKEEGIYFADPAFFSVFSFPLVKGNPATALTEANAVVLSETMAKKHFGKEDPMGKIIYLKQENRSEPKMVTGIFTDVPANSHLQFNFLLSYKALGTNIDTQWQGFQSYTYLLLSPQADPEVLEAKFADFVETYRGKDLAAENAREELFLQPLQQIHLYSDLRNEIRVNSNIRTIYFLIIIAVFILLLAWVNYINLSTARSVERAKEVGVRKVVGASRLQLIRQFLTEALVLNTMGAIIAVTIVQLAMPYFNDFTGQQMPLTLWSNSYFWLLFIGVFISGTILSGLYPAFALSSYQPVSVVKGKWRSSASGILLRKSLVVFQFVVSVLLITGTFAVFRQIQFMQDHELGLTTEGVVVVKTPFIIKDYSQFDTKLELFRNQVRQYPAVKNVATTDVVPGMETMYSDNGIKRAGSDAVSISMFSLIWADYDFVATYNIPLLAGRAFSKAYASDSAGAIINEVAAKALGFSSPQEAVNSKITYGRDFTYTVVGVINNYHQKSLKSDFVPMIFLLNPNAGRCFSLKLDMKDVAVTIKAIEETYQAVFPGNPFEYFFLDEFIDAQYKADRHFRRIFTLFALLAIFIACLGLLGLAYFATIQRTKEIGIRKVMGASVDQVIYLLSKDFMQLVLIANLIAWPLAYWSIRQWLENYTFRIPISPWLFLLPSILVILIALFTVSMQTIRSARANPVKALRYE